MLTIVRQAIGLRAFAAGGQAGCRQSPAGTIMLFLLQTRVLLATMGHCNAARREPRSAMKNPLKAQGFVRTPPFIAALLARWALRAPTEHVLDAGFGEGIFLLESAKRLLALGASVQRLPDLACYFVIYGARFLKPGGRLALIVSDSWLDMRYGMAFKDYLLRTFQVRGMVGFQSQVFPEVLVRPVLVLAEKRPETRVSGRGRVAFVSLNGRMPKAIPLDPCRLLSGAPAQASGSVVRLEELRPEKNWTPLLYAPRAYAELLQHPSMTPLASLAQVRIGLQSFAKMF